MNANTPKPGKSEAASEAKGGSSEVGDRRPEIEDRRIEAAAPCDRALSVPSPVGPRIRGLVFDCDGTLADTMPLHWRAWQRLTARHGFEFSEDRFYALGGVPTREILRILSAEQGLSLDVAALGMQKEDAYLDLLDEVAPIPEVVALVHHYQGRLPMAVATGGTHRVMDRVLRVLGIHHLFQAIVTNEDVRRFKPAPDVFLEAARQIGVVPGDCLGFEDTDLGIESIRAAGMEAVDVRVWLPAVRLRSAS
jgi:beta-phosphoglucomutase family hydrolase